MIASPFRRVALAVVAGALALGVSSCSSRSFDAATITYRDAEGSHTIHVTRADFTREIGEIVGSARFRQLVKEGGFTLAGDQESTTSPQFAASWLGSLVEQGAADAQFTSLRLTVTPEEQAVAERSVKSSFAFPNEPPNGPGVVFSSFPESLQKTLVERQARRNAVDDYYRSVTPAKERAFYDQFEQQICPSGRVVRHILTKDEATARAVLTELRRGASFADVARARSTDSASAKSGGKLGCLSRNVFVKDFESAAFAARFDVPTGPVKSPAGYHVILVSRPTFDDFSAEIHRALQQNPAVVQALQLESLQVWISPLYGTGGVSRDPQTDALHYQVTPPAAPSLREQREKAPAPAPTALPTTSVPSGG